MGNVDARFKGEIFRKDWAAIIASDRQLAKIIGARMSYVSGGLVAGQVVGRDTTSGFYVKYDDAVTGGADTAVGVLLDDVDFGSATGNGSSGVGTVVSRVLIGGCPVYKDNLTGLDANGITDLKARTVVDAAGTNLLIF